MLQLFGLQDELWRNSSKKIKLDPLVFSGNGSGGLAVPTTPTDVNAGECVIRRSARNRRPRGELRIVVSSSDKLSDLKIKVNNVIIILYALIVSVYLLKN